MPTYFTWNLDPTIIHLFGPFEIRWYSLAFLVGFLIGHYALITMARKEQKTLDHDSLLIHLILGTIIGARLGHVLFYGFDQYLEDPLSIIKTWEGGLASHGGYAGILIAMWLFARKSKLGFFWVADRVSFLAVMVGGFIRLGNFANSEILGPATTVPWAIIFERYDNVPRHPSQLYESVGYFTCAAIVYLAYRFWRRKPKPGRLLGLAIVLSFTFRFLIENLKLNQVAFEETMTLNMGQWLSIPFVLLGLGLLLGLQDRFLGRSSSPAPAHGHSHKRRHNK